MSAKGYAIHDTKHWTDFKVIDYELKKPGPKDIDVAITHCGVCGSDVHTITGGWGELSVKPCVVGHEIVGHVTNVGPEVNGIKVGDRVGVGAQVGSCMECGSCKTSNENYCLVAPVDTYNSKYPDGSIAQGGYSSAIRVHEQFVFPIPEGLASEDAAPMMCAGLTVYSPLRRNGAGPGKRVGIVGIGGLGHFGIMFAKALGAEVVAISHSPSKKEDALKMGASTFVSTKEEPDFFDKNKCSLDIIICSASSNQVPIEKMLSTLKVHGKLVFVGMPNDKYESLDSNSFSMNGCFLGSSHIGSKEEALEMLDLAAKQNIKPWVEVLDMKDAGKAVKRVYENDIRYRFVLKQDLA